MQSNLTSLSQSNAVNNSQQSTVWHTYNLHGTTFTLDQRYHFCSIKGVGSYGIVCACKNVKTGELVAIKKIHNAFENLRDAKRILREIKLLRHFNHENILGLKDILKPNQPRDRFNEVYIVTELMDTDLHQIIQSSQPLSNEHIQYFVYQILRGLKYIHSAGVIHRDLKPSNLLVNSDCLLKICDFGMARPFGPFEQQSQLLLTEYVTTRWYRAPEVILAWKHYAKEIDIWSVGCIFAELFGRKPLLTGKDYIHQIQRVIEILGTPSEEDIMSITNEQARNFVRSLGYKPKIPFERIYPHAPPAAIHLLEGMLAFNPSKRLTAEQALAHPYFANLHDPADEPDAPTVFNFDFENYDLTREMYRELIFNEIAAFHPELLNESASNGSAFVPSNTNNNNNNVSVSQQPSITQPHSSESQQIRMEM